MPTNDEHFADALTADKRELLEKLSAVFDASTALDFVDPKPFETKRCRTLEELLNVNTDERDKHFERLRSMDYYQASTQSLVRSDLEAAYQAFIRGQIARKPAARDELERFVRSEADVNAVNYYLHSSHHTSANPLQAHLLFHSSKLNEQRANLIKSASSNRALKQLDDDDNHLRQYFPETFSFDDGVSSKEKDSVVSARAAPEPRSLRVAHGEKKYHVTFLQDSRSPRRRQHAARVTDSAMDGDDSSKSDLAAVSDVHRESFPPLSLAALEECRPTITAKSLVASSTAAQLPRGNFIWEQSIVGSKHD